MLDEMTDSCFLRIFRITAAKMKVLNSRIEPAALCELAEIIVLDVLGDKAVIYLCFCIAYGKRQQPVP